MELIVSDVSNFTVGHTESIGSGEVIGTAEVTKVDTEAKTVTVKSLQPGDEGYVDPVELEKKMVEAERKRQEEIDPLEMASMFLTMYTPRFCGLVDKLSNRQLRRLVKGLAQYPTGKTYDPTDDTENEAKMIGERLIDSNMVLVLDTYTKNSSNIIKKANEDAVKNAPIEVHYGELNEEGKNEDGKET